MSLERSMSFVSEDTRPLAAEVLLRTLRQAGVDYLVVNPGTDFPSIVEAYAREPCAEKLPRAILATHETTAVSAAHGLFLATGKPAAVMVHVNVGLANAMCNLINASRDGIPLVLMSGRTPVTEEGRHGSRSGYIHWGQEMFDQAGMLREFVKWDYELRFPEHAGTVIRRATEVATAVPSGPVYISLPREILAAPARNEKAVPAAATTRSAVDPDGLRRCVDWIAAARSPVLITSASGRRREAVEAVADFAQTARIPVVEHAPRFLNMPRRHEWHGGYDPAPYLEHADLVIVLESEVPWFPGRCAPRADAKIVHVAEDPTFSSYPMRNFRSDLNLSGDVVRALKDLAIARVGGGMVPPRRGAAEAGKDSEELNFDSASREIARIVDDETTIFNEYPLRLAQCPVDAPESYFALSTAGGLGWALGAALGFKLGRPDRFVVVTLGDGAYVYANPISAHTLANAENLPILVILFNNKSYGGVQRATLSMYAQGAAAQSAGRFLAAIEGAPDFTEVARAHGAFAETVKDLSTLRMALVRAKQSVLDGRQAVVNILLNG